MKMHHCSVRMHCMFRSRQGRVWLFGFRCPVLGGGLERSRIVFRKQPHHLPRRRSETTQPRYLYTTCAAALASSVTVASITSNWDQTRRRWRRAPRGLCHATLHADLLTASHSILLPRRLLDAALYSLIVSIIPSHSR